MLLDSGSKLQHIWNDDSVTISCLNKYPEKREQIQKMSKNLEYCCASYGDIMNIFNLKPGIKKKIGRYLNMVDYKYHCASIPDLNRLLHDQSKYEHKKYFCEQWLHDYSRKDLFDLHKPDCKGPGNHAVKVNMPDEGKNKLMFQNYHKQMKVPFVIYADFEALTTKVEGQ